MAPTGFRKADCDLLFSFWSGWALRSLAFSPVLNDRSRIRQNDSANEGGPVFAFRKRFYRRGFIFGSYLSHFHSRVGGTTAPFR
jgi:hypothetical protein